MTTEEKLRVTNAMASAIEYIQKSSESSLGRLIVVELRAGIALVSMHEPTK